jgi:hypothetical protein
VLTSHAFAQMAASSASLPEILVRCEMEKRPRAQFSLRVDEKESMGALHLRIIEQFIVEAPTLNHHEMNKARDHSMLQLHCFSSKKKVLISLVREGVPYWFNRGMVKLDPDDMELQFYSGCHLIPLDEKEIEGMSAPSQAELSGWIAESKREIADDIVTFVAEEYKLHILGEHVVAEFARRSKRDIELERRIQKCRSDLRDGKFHVEATREKLSAARTAHEKAAASYEALLKVSEALAVEDKTNSAAAAKKTNAAAADKTNAPAAVKK